MVSFVSFVSFSFTFSFLLNFANLQFQAIRGVLDD